MDSLPPNKPQYKVIAALRPCRICKVNARILGQNHCQPCHNEFQRTHYDPVKQRDRILRAKFGISQYEYELMLFQQGGVCAVCKQPETARNPYGKGIKFLSVDHNHETGAVREILCHKCNYLLGSIERDRERAKKLLKYLKKHDM